MASCWISVSPPQLDDAERGFSFMKDGPLDMRMDPTSGQSAAEWLARADVDDIAWVLKTFGEERFAKKIARAIVHDRVTEPYVRTRQLAEMIARVNPSKEKGKHAATRSFRPSASISTASWTKSRNRPQRRAGRAGSSRSSLRHQLPTLWKIGW